MFFFSDLVAEIRQGVNGRWRAVEAVGQGGPIHQVLWESGGRRGAEKGLAAYRAFREAQASRAKAGIKTEREGPAGTRLLLEGASVSVRASNGDPLGNADFAEVPWRPCMAVGASRGALTASSIGFVEGWRRKGLASAAHDLVREAYGLLTVPNAAHGVPGNLSELAQGFWAVRATRVDVPGLSGDSLRQSFVRRGRLDAVEDAWQAEKIHAPGAEQDRCFAFALAAARLSGLPVVEGFTGEAGRMAWWLAAPDGSAITSQGLIRPAGRVLDAAMRPCSARFTMSPPLLETMAAAWFPGTDAHPEANPVFAEAETWAREILVQARVLRPEAAPRRDRTAEAEAAFRHAVPLLAGRLLGPVAQPGIAEEAGTPAMAR